MVRSVLIRSLTLALVMALLLPAFAGGKKGGRKQEWTGEKVGQRGRIDYEKGVLYATGLGAIPVREVNQAKAYLKARTYAKLDALRNLLMVVDHVRIDSSTMGSDFDNASDEIKAEVNGIVRGAQVIAERRIPMGANSMVEVTVATPLYGDEGVASVFLPEVLKRNRARAERHRDEDIAAPALPAEPSEADKSGDDDNDTPVVRDIPPAPVKIVRRDVARRGPRLPRRVEPVGENYTSLIVDARGLGICRCMSPKILRTDGTEVWGTVDVDPDWVIEHGIVVYAHTIEQAKRDGRAGGNPLIVRAVGRSDLKFSADPVLTESDAQRILAANSRDGFLTKYRVIFVLDPNQ